MGKWRKRSDDGSNRWIKKTLLRASNLCAICGNPILMMKDATIDHVVPLSKGGIHRMDNMQLAHEQCNWNKGNQLDHDEK